MEKLRLLVNVHTSLTRTSTLSDVSLWLALYRMELNVQNHTVDNHKPSSLDSKKQGMIQFEQGGAAPVILEHPSVQVRFLVELLRCQS